MRILPLVRAEFARITATRIGIATLIALMTVPVVYGGLYLWGNHDPYANLDPVPAAIVVGVASIIAASFFGYRFVKPEKRSTE